MIVKKLEWYNEEATKLFAMALARSPLIGQAYIELIGELGSGKTTFVRHLFQALGVIERVKSPTYAVVESYRLPNLDIWHFDFYRFDDPQEWEDAGFRDIFSTSGLKISEWPENAQGFLPTADLMIKISFITETSRSVTIQENTALGSDLISPLMLNSNE
mgnify:CR=1 FL=1